MARSVVEASPIPRTIRSERAPLYLGVFCLLYAIWGALQGELILTQDLTIDGDANSDRREVTLSGGDHSRIFHITGGGTDVSLRDDDGYEVSKKYQAIDRMSKEMGSRLSAPFMTLSFMALLVIPKLKMSDKGLFDGEAFRPTPLFLGTPIFRATISS